MSLSEATQRRLPQVKAGLLQGKTSSQIAVECGVRRETIERDKRAWRQSGEMEDWIKEEFIRLHAIIQKKRPVEAYRQIARLFGATLVHRVEQRVDVREIKLSWEHKE